MTLGFSWFSQLGEHSYKEVLLIAQPRARLSVWIRGSWGQLLRKWGEEMREHAVGERSPFISLAKGKGTGYYTPSYLPLREI